MNSTSEDIVLGWVPTNFGRGTIDIIWTCLATLIICTWSVLRMPPPEFTPSKFRDKFVDILQMILVPDMAATETVMDFVDAYELTSRLRALGFDNCTLTHGFFLEMEGFRIQYPDGVEPLSQMGVHEAITRLGFKDDGLPPSPRNTRPRWVSALKEVPAVDIHALSKSDGLIKLVACLQAFWLVSQVLTRWAQGLPITLLELTTIIYVFCTLINLTFSWAKPQNCCEAILLDCDDPSGIEEVNEKELLRTANYTTDEFHVQGPRRLRRYRHTFWIIMLCVFGASHCIAWNSYFPTTVERWMWRGAALSLSAYPPLASCYLRLGGPMITYTFETTGWLGLHLEEGEHHIAASSLGMSTVAVIIVARLYLGVEAFISLRALPASAYEAVGWSSYLPHI